MNAEKAKLLFASALWLLAQNYASADTTTGLIGHWRFSEASGNVAADSSSSGNNGTLQGGVTLTGNGFVACDGVDDLVTMGNSSIYYFGSGNFSVGFWVRKNANSVVFTNWRGICKWNDDATPTLGEWAVDLASIGGSDNKPMFATEIGGFPQYTTATNALTIGQWAHIVALRDGSNLKLFMNGNQEVVATGITGSLTNTGRNLKVAASDSPMGTYAKADFDELRIYNRALSSADIGEIFNLGMNLEPTNVQVTAPSGNSVFQINQGFTFSGNATDTDGTIVKMRFYGGASGNTLVNTIGTGGGNVFSFTHSIASSGNQMLRVEADDNNGASTSSGNVPIRINAPPTSASVTAPSGGSIFQVNQGFTFSGNGTDTDGTIAKIRFYGGASGTTLVNTIGTGGGNVFSFTHSIASAGNQLLRVEAEDNNGASTSSGNVSIRINAPPTSVSVTAPSDGSVFQINQGFTFSGNGTDTDGTIAKIRFYAGASGTTLVNTIGTGGGNLFSFTHSVASSGNQLLRVEADDNDGASTSSGNVSIRINAPPTGVSVTAPANGAVINPGTYTFSGTATDSDGSIAQMRFYDNGALVNTIGSGNAFSFNQSTGNVGTHLLRVEAQDNDNASTSSANISIRVNDTPVVTITAPAQNSKFILGGNVTFQSNVIDTDTISNLTYTIRENASGNLIAAFASSSNVAPFTGTWSSNARGTFKVSAVATDSYSLSSAASGNVIFTIEDNNFFLDFNDQKWNTDANEVTSFKNEGSIPPPTVYFSGNTVPIQGVKFVQNQYAGTALNFNGAGNAQLPETSLIIGGPSSITWGQRFTLETQVRKFGANGNVMLAQDRHVEPVPSRDPQLLWRINTSGNLQLDMVDTGNALSGNTITVASAEKLVADKTWTTLRLDVDLTKPSRFEAFKLFKNGASTKLAHVPAVAGVSSASSGNAEDFLRNNWLLTGGNSTSVIGTFSASGNKITSAASSGNQVVELNFSPGATVSGTGFRYLAASLDSFSLMEVTASGNPFPFTAAGNGRDENGFRVYSGNLLSGNTLTKLRVVAASAFEIKLYNGNPSAIDLPANFTIQPSGDPMALLKRESNLDELRVDFIKITLLPPDPVVTPADSFLTEKRLQVDPTATVDILIPAEGGATGGAIKRTLFSPAVNASVSDPKVYLDDFMTDGAKPANVPYDTHPTPPSVFHGIFEIGIFLDPHNFDLGGGPTFFVDFFLKRPGQNFLKIAEADTANTKPTSRVQADPESGLYKVRTFWNSRVPAFEWTSTQNTGPFREQNVELKFELR